MADVMVIGGGLSGLAAAYELEQQHVDYTLVEVKRELGGSIRSMSRDGFIIDAGAFGLTNTLDAAWLESLGLADALYTFDDEHVAFKNGTGALTNALANKITAPRLMQMAVSSIGKLDNGQYSVCFENGLLMDTKAVIIALPARYAERIFYGYITPLTEQLMSYDYDTVLRVSLGFRADEVAATLRQPPDMAYVFNQRTDNASRVPAGHVLWQFGLRVDPKRGNQATDVIAVLRDTYDLPAPVTQLVSYWAEADPISCHDDSHWQWVQAVREKLPDGVALIGSDYCEHAPIRRGISRLDERITQGQQAAQQIITTLV